MKPTQMQTFDALYVLASRDGRDERLFGNSIELARPAYERSLLGKGYPSAYLEFPPLLQCEAVHQCIPLTARSMTL